MKKILLSILFIFVAVLSFQFEANGEDEFKIITDSRVTQMVDGVTHTKIIGKVVFNGVQTNQQINYIGANLSENTELSLATGDMFKSYTNVATYRGAECWGMGSVLSMIARINTNNPSTEVIGGVNGDAYLINSTGQPLGIHIRDYRLINKHINGGSSTAVGYKDDGSVIIGDPVYSGYHINVYNSDNELKFQKPVVVNQLPGNDEIAVFFSNYNTELPAEMKKTIFDAIEIKFDAQDKSTSSVYFGEGKLRETLLEKHTPQFEEFVVTGAFDESILKSGDYVIVQDKITGEFADVRHAMGLWHPLIIDGQTYQPSYVNPEIHPRSAVGIKEDGTVFFVSVDGRQSHKQMDGMNFAQLIGLMRYFGAVEAYNLDGGGSSTFVIRNDENNRAYEVQNSPSDSRVRSVANGMFFVRGKTAPMPDSIIGSDNRTKLVAPNRIVVDNGNISFNEVANASGYYINVNGVDYYSATNSIFINFPNGTFNISVRVIGNSSYESSDYSESVIYQVYREEVSDLIELFKNYTKYN
ncbi:phosphodiester glycosidase family protein [Acholeplasma sp. OttesenSCG-928-E16]|nr:phosphodiester glycosidase family protein [Acholeplasma sp. OttesenSCG-928-E16]